MPFSPQPHVSETTENDHELLPQVASALEQAGLVLLERYSPEARPASPEELLTALARLSA